MDSIIPKGETKAPFIDPFLISFDPVSMVPIYMLRFNYPFLYFLFPSLFQSFSYSFF